MIDRRAERDAARSDVGQRRGHLLARRHRYRFRPIRSDIPARASVVSLGSLAASLQLIVDLSPARIAGPRSIVPPRATFSSASRG
jgi:hypothetical protein